MNTAIFNLVQGACLIMLLMTGALAVDLVRDMWALPLYDSSTWSVLAPQFGTLALFIAGIVAVEQVAFRIPRRVQGGTRQFQ